MPELLIAMVVLGTLVAANANAGLRWTRIPIDGLPVTTSPCYASWPISPKPTVARARHGMAWDPFGNGRVILYGGGGGNHFADAYEYDSTIPAWVALPCGFSHSNVNGNFGSEDFAFATVNITGMQGVLLHGGLHAGGTDHLPTMMFFDGENETWSCCWKPTTNPCGDPDTQKPCENCTAYPSAGACWTPSTCTVSEGIPVEQNPHGAVVVGSEMITVTDAKTWVLDVETGSWSSYASFDSSTNPGQLYAMAYHPVWDEVILYGGDNGNQSDERRTLRYDGGGTWTAVLDGTSTNPGWRLDPILEHFSYVHLDGSGQPVTTDELVLFGGVNNDTSTNDNTTWALTKDTQAGTYAWTMLDASSDLPRLESPVARTHHDAAFDPNREKVLLFGGLLAYPPAGPQEDTWELGCGPPEFVAKGKTCGDTEQSTRAKVCTEALPANGCAQGTLKVSFEETSLDAATTYAWDFGDGNTGTGKTTDHCYAPGVYTVTLTVTGDPCVGNAAPIVKKGLVHAIANTPSDPENDPEIAASFGPVPDNNPPTYWGANVGRFFYYDTGCSTGRCGWVEPNFTDVTPYIGNPNFGMNMGGGDINGVGGGELLTGPGPSQVFGPHVKAYNMPQLTTIAKVNYYAYSTLRYGVKVAASDQDDEGIPAIAEILTGPGPGNVFGPHVRGWNFDGGCTQCTLQVTPITKINFYAYGTLKYGVNVAGANMTEHALKDEILTGAGPGDIFDPQVRGFSYTASGGLSAIAKVNFNAYGTGKYGVNVAAGSVEDVGAGDLDAYDEIVTGHGPGSTLDSRVRVFDVDDGSVVFKSDGVAFTGSNDDDYGTTVAVGDLTCENQEPCEESILVGTGPDPANPPRIVGMEVIENVVNGLRYIRDANDDIVVDFNPYGELHMPDFRTRFPGYGVNVASVPPGERWIASSVPAPPDPTDHLILGLRQLVADIPDSTYVCDFCCSDATDPDCGDDPPPSEGEWSAWGSVEQKERVLDEIDALYQGLPDYGGAVGVMDQLAAIESYASDPTDGITNEMALAEVMAAIDVIRGYYDPMAFPSVAVTAVLDGFDSPSDLAYSAASSTLYARPGAAQAGTVQVLDGSTLVRATDRTVPTEEGEVLRMHVPAGRQELYVMTSRECSGGGCADYAIERLPGTDWVPSDAGYLDILTNASSSIAIKDLFTTSAGETQLKANAAWVCWDSSGTGTCKSIDGIGDFDTATTSTVGVTSRVYAGLAPSPNGGERLYAAHANGVDAIFTKTSGQPTSQSVLTYPSGFGTPVDVVSGTTDDGSKRLFVASADKLVAYVPTSNCVPMFPCSVVDSVDLDGSAVGIELSTDGRFVLVTRHPVGDTEDEDVTVSAVYDADTLDLVRSKATSICESEPCDTPPPTPMTVAVDAGHAFVSEPGTGRLAYVYLDAPRHRFEASLLETVIEATADAAWVTTGAKASTLQRAATATMLLDLADQAGSDPARRALVRQAAEQLWAVQAAVDGCHGGDVADDLVTSCYEAAGIWKVTDDLLETMSRDLVDPPVLP